jgi:hypothetical protein
MFRNCCEPLVNCESYSIVQEDPAYEALRPQQQMIVGDEGPSVEIGVHVLDGKGQAEGKYVFSLIQRSYGLKKGCWMTKSLLKVRAD